VLAARATPPAGSDAPDAQATTAELAEAAQAGSAKLSAGSDAQHAEVVHPEVAALHPEALARHSAGSDAPDGRDTTVAVEAAAKSQEELDVLGDPDTKEVDHRLEAAAKCQEELDAIPTAVDHLVRLGVLDIQEDHLVL
jgi:hypothetical protein